MSDTEETPVWDKSDPSGSLRRQAEWYNEKARTMFLQDGTHVELVILFKPDGQFGIGPAPPGMSRDRFAEVLKQTIRLNDFFGVVHISEAWVYVPPHPTDHTLNQIKAGEIAVSELKPRDKTEALIVSCECRDGTQWMWINPILRLLNGLALADTVAMSAPVEGRFARLF